MLLHIVARGKIGRSPEAELVERYLKRIVWPTKLTELAERGRLPPPPPNSVTVVLDESGKALSSTELARQLEAWRDGGKREARFLIGAADGHAIATGQAPTAAVVRPGDLAANCWYGRCSPNNCSARHRSLRTTLIIAKDERDGRLLPLLLVAPLLLAASAPVQPAAEDVDQR